jgi:hypothetical protein
MVPEEWPISSREPERSALPRSAGRGRLDTVRRDFFLDPADRLSEQERALMTAMLRGLVSDVADELRAALPPRSAVANDDDNQDLVGELSAAGLLDLPGLVELLLRRADEEQIASGVRARAGRRDGRFLQALVSDDDPSISAAAMALILARGRRRDRFGQLRLEFDDLPRPTAATLVRAVAAALRRRLVVTVDAASADRQLGAAGSALLATHDASRSLEALTRELVRLLDAGGRLDDELIASAADEGEVGLVAEALGRRAAIATEDAARHLLSGAGEELMLLLRMAAVSRELAARLLAGPGDLLGIADPAREIARFESFEIAEVDAAREWLQLDPDYRTALAALGQGRGQRAR